MLVMLQIVAPLQAFAFSSVTLHYLGRERKRQARSSAEAEYRALADTTSVVAMVT